MMAQVQIAVRNQNSFAVRRVDYAAENFLKKMSVPTGGSYCVEQVDVRTWKRRSR